MKGILTTFSLLISPSVFSGGIPVIDVTNIVQTTKAAIETAKQTAQQAQQIKNEVEQIKNQIEQIKSMKGSYGMGELLNTQSDKDFRRFIPRNWEETLDLLESGVLPGHVKPAQAEAILARKNGERYTKEEIFTQSEIDNNIEEVQRYIKASNTIYSTMGAARQTYNDTNRRYDNVESLNAEIDETENIKSAMDLNNRLLVENAAFQNELIRQTAILNIQSSKLLEQRHNDRAADYNAARFMPNTDW